MQVPPPLGDMYPILIICQLIIRGKERLIVELESSEERLEKAIHIRGMSRELKLVALALLPEPSIQETKNFHLKRYACARPEEAIAAAFDGLGSGQR